MEKQLTSIAIAALSTLLAASPTYAATDRDGGIAGANGGSDPTEIVTSGGTFMGAPGKATAANNNNPNGQAGINIQDKTVKIVSDAPNSPLIITGKAGTAGETQSSTHYGGAGNGGNGGASVYGGYSSGGPSQAMPPYQGVHGNGGTGGDITNNHVALDNVTLVGANGGKAGSGVTGGLGGDGGGSVYGGFSSGGNAAQVDSAKNAVTADGGHGGTVSANTIRLRNTTLIGANGGNGSDSSQSIGGGGQGGNGGGSVYGGVSLGGIGGYAYTSVNSGGVSNQSTAIAHGGNGGDVSGNKIFLENVTLTGGKQGSNGFSFGSKPIHSLAGGSVFGGFSRGGTGGYSQSHGQNEDPNFPSSASGGHGGNTSNNSITIAGKTSIPSHVYGGYSQGAGFGYHDNDIEKKKEVGLGGRAENNTLTLIGNQIDIKGAIYGGYSANGDGTLNPDKAFAGNTLNLQNYRGSVAGIYNFENYHWVLPKDEVNGDTLITITGKDKVELDHTQHSVAMENDGNRLNAGDQITLIDKAQGSPTLTTPTIRQGHFITYDTTLAVSAEEKLVLRIAGKDDTTPPPEPEPTPKPEPKPEPSPDPTPAGRVTPTAKAFLEGRLASLAQVNQGADAISGIGLDAARNSVGRCGANLFMFIDGGSNRYETGSHIKLRNTNFGFGAANCFELQSKSQVLVGAFVEHGNGNYDSYNQFAGYDDVHGWGKVRYTGAGVLMHMNVAGTSTNTGKQEAVPSSIARNDGLYLDAAIRAGKAKTRFDSNLVDPEGLKGSYNAKSTYYSVMAGAGYALPVDEKQAVDLYSRYTWSHIGSDTVSVGKDTLNLETMNSSRLRLGARYSYAVTPQVTPYVGLAYEREFSGKSKGSAYGMAIDAPTLKGNTGIAELGLTVVPNAAKQALSVNFGVQGYFSDRKGGAANLRVRYAF